MRRAADRRWIEVAALLVAAMAGLTCGGGGGDSPTENPVAGQPNVVTVEVRDDFYDPQSVTIAPGDTVRWVLRGSHAGHTVTERNGAFDSGFVFGSPGDTFERVFPVSEAGQTFEYACATHSGCCGMRGSVRVGANAPPPAPGY